MNIRNIVSLVKGNEQHLTSSDKLSIITAELS
jgi:hypothetical protein